MENIFKSKIFIALFAVLIIGSAGFLVYKKNHLPALVIPTDNEVIKSEKTSLPVQQNISKSPSSAVVVFPGFKLYKNAEFGFEIQYPDSWQAVEESMENVRGEQTKGFFFNPPSSGPESDLRFAILPRDGLSYGLPNNGTTTLVMIGGSPGSQTKYVLKNGRRLWLLHPQYGLNNWSQDIGRIDVLSSALDPAGDTAIFEKMLNSFKLLR